jgi:hypothetical protein
VSLNDVYCTISREVADDPDVAAERVRHALRLLIRHGQAEHHKAWCIDQVVRILAGYHYDDLVAAAKDGEDGPDTNAWSTGVAP